jgi:hypothetical protein
MSQHQSDIFSPASRNSDPITSHKAEGIINLGARAVRMAQVLELIKGHPGATTGELSRHMLSDHPELPVRVAVESPHKRTKDLEDKGLVVRGYIRKCRDSGRDCITWWAK